MRRPVVSRFTLGILTGWIAVSSSMFILMTPYRGDDIINSSLPRDVASGATSYLGHFTKYTSQWITEQGRFFPGSVAWSEFAFGVFNTRETYKMWLMVLSLGVAAALSYLAMKLGRQFGVGPITVVALAGTWALRDWFDALTTFAGLLPGTVLLSLVALILLTTRRSPLSMVAGALVWGFVLVCYEVAIVFTPFFMGLVWAETKSKGRVLALAIPAAIQVAIVLYIRVTMSHPYAPAYTINLDPNAVFFTYLRQLGASLPLSAYWYPGAVLGEVPLRVLLMSLAVVGVPALLILLTATKDLTVTGSRPVWNVAATGLTITLCAPILTAVASRWQTELPAGQGYLSVVWGYAGVALLATAIVMALRRWELIGGGVWAKSGLFAWCIVMSTICALTFSSNYLIVSRWLGLPSTTG